MGDEVYNQTTFDKLKTFQSTGLRTMGCFRYSTPTSGLEILTHTYPLPLYIKVLAALNYFRTRGSEKFSDDDMLWKGEETGHRASIKKWINELLGENSHLIEFDDIRKHYLWDHKYVIDTESYSKSNDRKGIPILDSDISIYTDGSLFPAKDPSTEKDRAGAGMAVYDIVSRQGKRREATLHEDDWHLGQSTIFQCEMYALKKAAEWIIDNHDKPGIPRFSSVAIFSDSESSLKALLNNESKSSIVIETVKKLNTAASLVHVVLRWVKAHVDHMGNERADELAKEGAEADLRDPVPDLPKMPFSKMKALIHSKALEVWSKEWNENLMTKYNHRQTKNWREKPDGKAARELVQNNSRVTFSQKVGIMTGHSNFAYHENLVSKGEESDKCWLCDEDCVQDAEHILRECPKFWSQREIIFGNERPDLRLITDKQLSTFIKVTEEDFPWFPPTNTNEDIENDPDQESVCSQNEIPACCRSPERPVSETNSDNSNPGYDLFESDSNNEQESLPDEIILPPSDNEEIEHSRAGPND